MKRVLAIVFGIVLSALIVSSATGQPANLSQTFGQPDLAPILERVRASYGLPSVSAVVVQGGKVVSHAVVGERAIGGGVPVTLQDQYQLGSISKSFTATVIAKLVEQGKLRWDTTLDQALPDVPKLGAYKTVTLEMLLSHTAGFPANVEQKSVYAWNLNPAEARAQYLKFALMTEPEFAPGQMVAYSNAGFVIASLIAERAGGKPWDALVREIVLEPLGMKCNFGVIFEPLTNPHPHLIENGRAKALEPVAGSGNSPVLNGADNLRCNLSDLGKYLAAHLEGERGQDGIIRAESFKFLHRARANGGQDIRAALGWFVFPGGEIWHNGSNTLNYAEMILLPKQDTAIAVATNAAGGGADARAAAEVLEGIVDLIRP
jgi:CubicO group peptidase (beta-lactamase class C family)